jgi:hypothetical protein
MYSRNGHDFTDRFPSIAQLLHDLPAKAAVLDGEVVASFIRSRSSIQPIIGLVGPGLPVLPMECRCRAPRQQARLAHLRHGRHAHTWCRRITIRLEHPYVAVPCECCCLLRLENRSASSLDSVARHCADVLHTLSSQRQPISLSLYALAMILLTLVTLVSGAVRLRGRSMRILLLRPFGEARMSRALKKVVRLHLGHLGLVYTLSDRHYRPNPFLRLLDIFGLIARIVLYLLSPLRRPSIRIATVTTDMHSVKLAYTVTRHFRPRYRSLLSGGQAFNIRSSDNWWQRIIALLMNSSDLIVMDVPKIGAGSSWEIEQIDKRQFLDRCIFIVQKGYEDDARKSLTELRSPAAPPLLFGLETGPTSSFKSTSPVR